VYTIGIFEIFDNSKADDSSQKSLSVFVNN